MDQENLTATEFRTKLYNSLHQKGIINSLQSQLRSKLVSEVRHLTTGQPVSDSSVSDSDVVDNEDTLVQRAANSLICDHLKHCSYDYTLSVFLPECGLSQAKVFTTRDLLQLMSISPSSALFKSLTTKISSRECKRGFLWELLTQLSRHHGRFTQDTGVQTENTKITTISLDEKFKQIDDYFSTKLDDTKMRGAAVEEKIITYQRQLEERSRTEMKLEMERFKEMELARIRFEEREKCRKELERTRTQLEQTYQAKLEALVDRERNSIDRLQKQQELQEKEVFSQRQSILDEIELVHQRDAETRRQKELNDREKKLWEEKMKTREELVKKREEINKKNELEYEQKLRETTKRYKLDLQAQLMEKQQDLDIREMRIKDNEARLDEELRAAKDTKNELRDKRLRVTDLESELTRTKHDYVAAQKNLDMLNEKVRNMIDYPTLKQENAVLHNELDSVKTRLAETQRDIMLERQKHEELLREMGERASRPTPEMLMLQQELDRTKAALRQAQALAAQQRQHAHNRIHQEMAINSNLVKEFEKQNIEAREMTSHVYDLQHQLHHTQRVLGSEAYRQAEASRDFNRHVTSGMYDMADNGDETIDQLLQSHPHDHVALQREDLDLAAGNDRHNSNEYSYSSDIVKETRQRLEHLEKEADNLEQNYRNFQYKLSSTSVMPGETHMPDTSTHRSTHYNTTQPPHPSVRRQAAGYDSPPRSMMLPRPQSSTPHKRPDSSAKLPELDISLSTVASQSPDRLAQVGRTTAVSENRPIRVDDLEARPGSPSVMIVESSFTHGPEQSTADKTMEQKEAERLQQEQEDREFEERMKQKEEERRKKQEEARKREEEELARLSGTAPPASATVNAEVPPGGSSASQQPQPSSTAAPAQDDGIDPVMKAYMEKVKQQKEHEKQVVKRTLETWNRNRTISQTEETHSQSEDISVGEAASLGGGASDNAGFEDW